MLRDGRLRDRRIAVPRLTHCQRRADPIQEAEAVARLADRLAEPSSHSATQFERCLAILRSTYERHGKLVLVGLGKSSIVARKTAATFNSLGPSVALLRPV